MEVWWIGANGSVQAGYWYEGFEWKGYELDLDSESSTTSGIAAVSRIQTSMEVWWISTNGSIRDANWYEGTGWR
jgi:hypothetical protein